MTLTELKKNLKKYAKLHKGDWCAYGEVKIQISNAVTTAREYDELVKFYVQEAGLY